MSVSADLNAIPPQLRYGASQSVCRVQRINNIRPLGSDSGSSAAGDSFRFDFPSRQLVNLASLQLLFTANVENITTAANGINACIPASWKLIRRVVFYIGNTAVSGALSSHHHQLYNALVAASGNTEWLYSSANKNAIEFVLARDELLSGNFQTNATVPATTSKSAFLCADDFLGLPRSRNSVIDQSLWGQLSMQVELAESAVIRVRKTGDGSATDAAAGAVTFRVSGMRASVEVIESLPAQYISLLSARLSQTDQPIRLPYMDFRTQIVSNNGSVRTAVNTNCLDAVVAVPLGSAYSTPAAVAAGENAPAFTYNSGRTMANAETLKCQWQVGQSSYPRSQVEHGLEVAEITKDSLHGASRDATALMFVGASDDSTIKYSKHDFLTKNFLYYQRLSLNGAGYQDGHLTGVSTNGAGMDIVFNSTNFTPAGGFILIAHLVTACLVYSPANASVSVEQ
jgi:hypothetical protein